MQLEDQEESRTCWIEFNLEGDEEKNFEISRYELKICNTSSDITTPGDNDFSHIGFICYCMKIYADDDRGIPARNGNLWDSWRASDSSKFLGISCACCLMYVLFIRQLLFLPYAANVVSPQRNIKWNKNESHYKLGKKWYFLGCAVDPVRERTVIM